MKESISCDVHLLNELLETDVEVEWLEIMLSWRRQVSEETVGFPE
jgi:hypothetical protein